MSNVSKILLPLKDAHVTIHSSVGVSRHLSLSLFGHFDARLDGVALSGFEYNKVRALLAYLAIEHKQPHSRASLCALLWPDLGENAARQNLSQALTRLRHLLGDKQAATPFLLATTETVQLNPAAAWDVDVHRFTNLIANAERHAHRGWHLCTPCAKQLQAAVGEYRGDFLAHLYLSDSIPFEEWATPLRHRLQSKMLSALERVARYAEWRGDFAQAVEATHHQIELEPLRELPHRELMRLLALSGQQGAARLQYESLRRLLHTEVGAIPEPESTALYQKIRATPTPESFRHLTPPPSTLPAVPTEMIGREWEVQSLCEGISQAARPTRLLTITGAPGIGKTRLALEVAHRLRFDFQEGVHWIELAPILDAEQVPAAIAHLLGVMEQPRYTLTELLIERLKTHHILLVLDNFEQVLEAAPFMATLLSHCPALSLLITSRTPLHLRSESQFTLEPLSLPNPDIPFDLEDASKADAVQLFARRAQAIQPIWRLTAETTPSVMALCRRMDGLPLAIELIAPRLKSLSVSEILQQFESPLNAAPPGPRDMPARHRTLRSAIHWSYERLTPAEQRLFAHLGLFWGGSTLESVQAVMGDSTAVMPLLESLHDASLLYTRTIGGATRFYQLETIREFARERLEATGATEQAMTRYIDYFVQLADDAYVQLLGTEQAKWSSLLAAEEDNLRAAQRMALDTRHVEKMLRIATGTWRFWWQRGNLREALAWLESGLAPSAPVAPLVRSRALRAAGVLAMGLNEYPRARQRLEEALEVALQANALYDYGSARTNLGLVMRELGDFDAACAHLEQSATLMRTMEEPRWVKFPIMILASLQLRLGNIEQAATLYQEGLRLNQELGDTEGTANALYGIGTVFHARGEYDEARQWCEESFSLYQTLNHQYGSAWCHNLLGEIAFGKGEIDTALPHYRQSLTIWLQRGDDVNGARTVTLIAALLQQQGDAETAARFMGTVNAIYEKADLRMTPSEHIAHHALLERCRTALGDALFAAAQQQGRTLTLQEATTDLRR